MATETFTFTDTGNEHLKDIKSWFEANATDYFDSFELSDDNLALTCKIGEKAAFKISRDTNGQTYRETIYNYDGTSKYVGSQSSNDRVYINKIVKTDAGIAINKITNGNRYTNYIFITKTNKNNTAFVFKSNLNYDWMSDNSNVGTWYVSAFSAEATGFDEQGRAYLTSGQTAGYEKTILSPILLKNSGGTYLPNCLKTVYSEVIGTECTLEHDNTKYFYGGFIALKE